MKITSAIVFFLRKLLMELLDHGLLVLTKICLREDLGDNARAAPAAHLQFLLLVQLGLQQALPRGNVSDPRKIPSFQLHTANAQMKT